jgi:hypothetical protein
MGSRHRTGGIARLAVRTGRVTVRNGGQNCPVSFDDVGDGVLNSAKPFKSSASPQPDLPMILSYRDHNHSSYGPMGSTVPIPTRAPPQPQHVVVRASLRGLQLQGRRPALTPYATSGRNLRELT